MPSLPIIQTFESLTALANTAARNIAVYAAEAIAARGKFIIAISGGSLPKIVFPALIDAIPKTQWTHWHIFWADERLVPQKHPDSNFRLARERLFDHVPIPPKHIFPVDTTLSATESAQKYQQTIEKVVGTSPIFDAILLGVGPDGHTASLFPGHPVLNEKEATIAPIFNSPKPPPKRVTLTLPVLNRARHIFFIVTGKSKADILPRVFSPNDNPLPASMVHPPDNPTRWYLDAGAAKNLRLPAKN